MLAIAIVALLLVGAAGFAAASLRALAMPDRARDMASRRRFLSEFDDDGLPANVLVETYEAIGRRLTGQRVRVSRDTLLCGDLALNAADVEDIALLVAARCDGRLPAAADLNVLDSSVHTVGELIRFLRPFCTDVDRSRARLALMA